MQNGKQGPTGPTEEQRRAKLNAVLEELRRDLLRLPSRDTVTSGSNGR